MTNEMKLITALCDALGFDVEKLCVNQDDINKYTAKNIDDVTPQDVTLEHYGPAPVYEYKLTKSVEKELTPDEKAVEDYILRNEAMLTKQVEEPFTKLKENDEIFNTEMFGEVRIGRFVDEKIFGSHEMAVIDSRKNGHYFRASFEDSPTISYIIKAMDKMYIARGKA